MTRLVLVCMAGHTPLRPANPVHCPPSFGLRSKIVGSNPCDSNQRAAASPPRPAPITATLLVILELSHVLAPSRYAQPVADTSYAQCGDLSLAYQVFGEGPVELVYAGSFVSHVELFWTQPEFKAFFEQLATFCR